MTASLAMTAPIETAVSAGHTQACLNRLNRLDAYVERWPGLCPICLGWQWTAAGDCPNCVNNCPRCGQDLVETGRCSACQWEDGAIGFLPVIGGSWHSDLLTCDDDCSGRALVLIALFDGRSGRWILPRR